MCISVIQTYQRIKQFRMASQVSQETSSATFTNVIMNNVPPPGIMVSMAERLYHRPHRDTDAAQMHLSRIQELHGVVQ